MVRIPEFQQRQLASSVTTSTITSIGAAEATGARVAAAGAQEFQQIRQEQLRQREIMENRRLAVQSAEFNSNLEMQAQEAFSNFSQDPEVQANPSLMRERLPQVFQDLKSSDAFTQQPERVQAQAIQRLSSLQTQYNARALNYEADQDLQNNIRDLDATQTNYERMASNSDADITDILSSYGQDMVILGEAIGNTAKGREIQENGSRAIVEQRINRLIEQSDFGGANALLSEEQFGDLFDAKTRTKIRDSVERAQRAKQARIEAENFRQRGIKAVVDALRIGAPIDAKDKNTQKLLNEFYVDSGINDAIVQNDVQAAGQLVDIAVRTNFIPAQAESTIRGQLTNGNRDQKQYAASLIMRMQEEAPRALDVFARRDLEQANLAVSYIRSGVDPDRAFRFAEEQTDPTKKDIIQARRQVVAKDINKIDFAALATDALDTGLLDLEPELPEAPIARDSILADYRNIYEGFAISTGDKDVAQTLAKQEFTRLYGDSNVTGNRQVMKYPPENYYSVPGIDNKWMQKQLQKEISDITMKDIDLDNVVVLADSVTVQEAAGGKPSYQVFVKDDNGQFNEVRDADSNLLRYRFDPTEVIENRTKKLIKEQEREDIETLREVRKKKLLRSQSLFTRDYELEESVLRYRGLLGGEAP